MFALIKNIKIDRNLLLFMFIHYEFVKKAHFEQNQSFYSSFFSSVNECISMAKEEYIPICMEI